MQHFEDSYSLSAEAQVVLADLSQLPELAPLGLDEARIPCILSQRAPMWHGWPVRAWIARPAVQGPFKGFFDWALAHFANPEADDPDFVIMIDAAIWSSASKVERDHLIFHELMHLCIAEDPETGAPKTQRDGRPAWKLRPHTFEAFPEELARFAAVMATFDELAQSVAVGYRLRVPHSAAS